MKKFSIVVITIFFSTLSFAQSNDELSIRKVLSTQQAAWNAGSIENFMQGYWQSDSLMFIGKSGVTYGWQKTLDNYKKNYPDTAARGRLTFQLLQLKPLSSGYFFVVGKWQLERSIGNIEGHFSLLFKKFGERWLIIADHSS